MQIEHITPGVLVIRQVLDINEQIDIIKQYEMIQDRFKTPTGDWNFPPSSLTDGTAKGLRGKIFEELDPVMKKLADKLQEIVEKTDVSLVGPILTHLLTWWYPTSRGIGWHIDSYGNGDGDLGGPVYSLTLGNSCIFKYKLVIAPKISGILGETEIKGTLGQGTRRYNEIILNSGDLLVFGGAQRLMGHSVPRIIKGSFVHKDICPFDARINLTFRSKKG